MIYKWKIIECVWLVSYIQTRCVRLFSLLFIIFFSLVDGCEKILYLFVFRLFLSPFLRVKRSRRRIVSERRASIAERRENIRVRRYLTYCYILSSKNKSISIRKILNTKKTNMEHSYRVLNNQFNILLLYILIILIILLGRYIYM
jgi:hypothetical protein